MKSFSQNRVKQSPYSQTLSLVLGGHNQLLSLVLNPHIQTLSLVLGGSNIALSICEAPWEPTIKLLTLKKRLLGGNPMLYLSIFHCYFMFFYRLMIMGSHKINWKSKNNMKNRKKSSTPWRKTCWRLNASKSFLQGVIFLLLFLILFLILVFFFMTPHDHEPNKT